MTLISTTRRRKKLRQSAPRHGTTKPHPAFSGRDSQVKPGSMQPGNQIKDAGKEIKLMVTRQIVIPVTLDHLRKPFFRQRRNGVTQRVGKSKADHVRCPGIGRLRQTKITTRRLNGENDRASRIQQRPIPVKHQEIEILAHNPVIHCSISGGRNSPGLSATALPVASHRHSVDERSEFSTRARTFVSAPPFAVCG